MQTMGSPASHCHIRLTDDRRRQFQKQLGRVAGAAEEDDIRSFALRRLTAELAGDCQQLFSCPIICKRGQQGRNEITRPFLDQDFRPFICSPQPQVRVNAVHGCLFDTLDMRLK